MILHGFLWCTFSLLSHKPNFVHRVLSFSLGWRVMAQNFLFHFPQPVVPPKLTSEFSSHKTRKLSNFKPLYAARCILLWGRRQQEFWETPLVPFFFPNFCLLVASSQCLQKAFTVVFTEFIIVISKRLFWYEFPHRYQRRNCLDIVRKYYFVSCNLFLHWRIS